MTAPNSFIGSPIERREDFRFLSGRGEFVDDLTRDGLLNAVILRSPFAHGRIRSIDASAALALRGVHAVITATDLGGAVPTIPLRLDQLPAFRQFEQPVIAYKKVRYVGEPVAVVLAENTGIAEDALEAITLDIEPLPPVADRYAAQKGEVLLFEESGSNLASTLTGVRGDADAAFRQADYVRRERFQVQRHTAMPMEPRGLLAEVDAGSGRLTISGACKVPYAVRRLLAKQMGRAEDSITMVENDVGGGFGVRGEFYPEDFLIPFAARLTGRPVKWIEDRREHFLATNHAREMDAEVEIACRSDGTVLALRGHAYVDMGAYFRTNAVAPARNVAQVLGGPYRVPNIHMEASMLMTNKTPVGTYRGPGRFEADFIRERLFDMAAQDLRIDRVEFRRRNLVTDAEMPYTLAKILPYGTETECDSGDYQFTLERCLSEIGWAEKTKLQGQLIDGRYHGLGIGCYIESGAAGPKENARLVLEPDGSVSVYVGSSALGQGVETSLAQVAADALEMPMERIRGVFHGSTTYLREGFGTYGSRSMVMGGSAIVSAAAALRETIRKAAANRFNCAPNDVAIVDGKAVIPNHASIPLGELAADGLSAYGSYASDKRTYSYGTHAAHIAVDPKTGQVEIIQYVSVEDVGRIINPLTLHGQTIGAIVQGLGGALLEHLVYDGEAQLLSGSFADYLMPTATDFPDIQSIALERRPSPNNPLGAKGAGEGGIIPVGGVVANAVASALSSFGVQPCELPLSPMRVWTMIDLARRP
jgi:carbon-monoxide dehydrogenase large subunit